MCLLMCICKYHTWRRTWNHIGYALPKVKHWSFHHLLRQVLPNVDRRQPSGKILHAPPDKRQRNINQIIWPCSQPSLPFFTFCFPFEVARINATTFSTFLNISQHFSTFLNILAGSFSLYFRALAPLQSDQSPGRFGSIRWRLHEFYAVAAAEGFSGYL